MSEDQERTKIQLAVSLQTEFERTWQRNWTEFFTGDEFWILWKNFPKGC
jgi:hypothetical protein